MTTMQFEQNEAHYAHVAGATKQLEQRHRERLLDEKDEFINDETLSNSIQLQSHEVWLNNLFPVTRMDEYATQSLHSYFEAELKALMRLEQIDDSKNTVSIEISSSAEVTINDLLLVDRLKNLIINPIELVDYLTKLINYQQEDDILLRELITLRWFVWNLIKK